MTETETRTNVAAGIAIRYAQQAEKLSLDKTSRLQQDEKDGTAVAARFITPLDPVVETAGGNRLPAIPVTEAHKLNVLKEKVEGKDQSPIQGGSSQPPVNRRRMSRRKTNTSGQDDYLDLAIPASRTHPLFPPLPLYGPPSFLRNMQCRLFQISSFFLSTAFLAVIALGALFTFIPKVTRRALCRLTFVDPDKHRPFHQEERRRAAARDEANRAWARKQKAASKQDSNSRSAEPSPAPRPQYEPLEGGPDKLVCSVRYYARRIGLDVEEFKVQTEDGFLIDLWHVYDPTEHTLSSAAARNAYSPNDVANARRTSLGTATTPTKRYPLLLMHGLLQSSGAFCCSDDDSLAFYLHKSGYDVWLGNNRCGFNPQHTLLQYNDPRMWAWNIRQMGVLDLPALVSRVLSETGFPKLGLIAHSQGTTQTFVALAKEQRPDLGEKISVFCALAPAVYAGPLIGKIYFKFMRMISPAMFRMFFGIHAFMPLMMLAHKILPSKIYGEMGYVVFSFLFNWTDRRWDRGLRNRAFQFAPVYVSSESMRWWLGRECFARHRCILSTREVISKEEQEDQEFEVDKDYVREESSASEDERTESKVSKKSREERENSAWYDSRVPPMALWIAGSDDLVDGRRLIRRFDRGREPCVNVVHKKVIPEYEHLDVLWAIDAIEKVGQEVKDVIWKTMREEDRKACRPILGVALDDEKSDEC